MKVIFVPGFWDAPQKFQNVSEIFVKKKIDCEFLDYKRYKLYGKNLNSEVFAKIVESLNFTLSDSIVICYSMGASFIYDYLKHNKLNPKKLIFVNPLLEKIDNEFISSYKRFLDMYKQNQVVGSIANANRDLFPLVDVAFFQKEYNKQILFDAKLEINAVFVWGNKDIICPIKNYLKYKNLFAETKLIEVPNQYHNWMVYNEPVLKYLLPEIKAN